MLTQGQTEGLTLMSERAFADLENRIMSDIVNRLKINGSSTATTDWQITRLQQYGISERDITAWIAEAMQTTDAETKKMLSDTLYQEYNKQKRFYKIEGAKQVPFKDNEPIQNLIKATTAQTHGTFQNITQSMGFAMKDPAGKMRYQSLRNFYTQTLDNAMMDIESGAFSYNTVLDRTINTMTNSGLRYIDYASGVSSRIEVAVRRALMTGYGQVQRYMSDQIADELGTEYFEVSAHSGARPEHEEWQGGVYTKDELYSICGLDDALGLCGINCYHSYDPFFPGISKRRYTDEQLEALKAEDAKEIEFNGKQYNKYQALQEQRKMERQMRKYRQDIDLLKKGEADAETIEAKQIKYQTKFSQYKAFSDRMALPMQRDRIFNDGLKVKPVANLEKPDIIINKAVGAANKLYSVRLPDGRDAKLAGGSKITKIKTFAGKGTDTDIRIANILEERYGYPAKEWEKVRGEGIVRDEGQNKKAELHWYEAQGDRYEMKVKRWFDDEN
ncbi:MAG: phage minor capsid protein [Pseudoramibacter sp.]